MCGGLGAAGVFWVLFGTENDDYRKRTDTGPHKSVLNTLGRLGREKWRRLRYFLPPSDDQRV